MKVEQRTWIHGVGWDRPLSNSLRDSPQVVLVFGSRPLLGAGAPMDEVHAAYPNVTILGCSTAGQICDTHITDNSVVLTAIHFDSTIVRTIETYLEDASDSFASGQRLVAQLPVDGLAHVFVLSDGLRVNGSELVKGLSKGLPPGVAATGGLSGDGSLFEQTTVYFNGAAKSGRIVAIGMYGQKLRVGYASVGGWDSFGPERVVTRSRGNALYELDGESALALYKRYLGAHAAGLPASGLRFPLSVRLNDSGMSVVRTILAIDEQQQSLIFAGDVPQGVQARLMRANFDRLIDGATGAANASCLAIGQNSSELAILISCVGRKLVLQQRTEEEVEAVRNVLGTRPAMTGFYSYGEISPFGPAAPCELHNQTMTITVFAEAA